MAEGAKEDFKTALEHLKTLRDEVKVRAHLGRLDLQEAWETLSQELDRISREATEATRESLDAAMSKLREFSQRLRRDIEEREQAQHGPQP
jgi:hypothetical protein